MGPRITIGVIAAMLGGWAPAHAAGGDGRVEGAARLDASVGLGPEAGAPGGAIGASVAVAFGPASVEADVSGGADVDRRPRVVAALGARLRVGATSRAPPAGLSLTGAVGGGSWSGELRPVARLGVAYDAPLPGRTSARFSLAWQSGEGGGALIGGVGFAWRDVDRPPRAELAAAAPLVVDAPGAMVWVPHPVCEWVPASELPSFLPADLEGLTVQVRADGRLPEDVTLSASAPSVVELARAPAYGSVVVVASPGDRVTAGGATVVTAADGTAVFGAPEGAVTIEVVGGGRHAVLQGSVAGGYVLWLRAPAPPPLTIRFAEGSSTLPREAETEIRAFASALGGHRLRIVGSYDPTEEPVDVPSRSRLASGRAEAVAAALASSGAPVGAIAVLASERTPNEALADPLPYARIEVLAAEPSP